MIAVSPAFAEDFTLWKYWRVLRLNTAVDGAALNTSVTLTNFPVLIRLDAQSFNFTTAKSDGTDLRFSLTDGTLLPYEIESWSATSQQAVIWVKVPSILGNNTDQNIIMRWGNTGAANVSNGQSVFTNNYNSVWHLGDQPSAGFQNTATGNITNDYTVNTSIANKTGLIGQGQVIMKWQSGQYIRFPGPTGTQTGFTLSAWVKVTSVMNDMTITTPDYRQNDIIGNFKWWPTTMGYGMKLFGSQLVAVVKTDSTNPWLFTAGVNVANEWRHMAITWQCGNSTTKGTLKMYVNGSLVSTQETGPALAPYSGSSIISSTDGNQAFAGSLDQVVDAKSARSEEWLKCEYMNQKADQKLVVFTAIGNFTQYLPLDGTKAMEGNLNMAGHNISQIDTIKGDVKFRGWPDSGNVSISLLSHSTPNSIYSVAQLSVKRPVAIPYPYGELELNQNSSSGVRLSAQYPSTFKHDVGIGYVPYNDNGMAGVGTANLSVNGDINFTGELYKNGIPFNPGNWSTSGTGGVATSGNVSIAGAGYVAGSFGVGTTASPTVAKFEVAGTSLLNGGTANLDGADLTFLQNSGKMLIGWNRTGGNGECDFIANRDGGSSGGFAFYDYANDVAGTLTPLMRILGNGNVGIGTNDPKSCKLAVEGTIGCRKLIVTVDPWADYVFSDGYKMQPLSEVESYIKNNKHLPGLPSSDEVIEKGVSVGDMQAKLLEKVEELTLRLIAMEKENNSLKNKVESLVVTHK